ncbi:MAG: Bug family tripartite tricarboxylate transporter substrate binding protein [Burkholderiales bacterium]
MTSIARLLLAIAIALASFATTSQAQPSKRPVRVLVGAAPGGPSDVQIRLLLPVMSEALGQVLIVDNRASANGVVASEIASRAAPDGHTLLVGNSGTHGVNATLYTKLGYDPIRDFVPISQFSTTGLVVAGHPRLPGKAIQDFAAHAKAHPGKLNAGIAGATGELAGDSLWAQLGIKLVNVRYKGSAPTTQALIAGEIDVSMLTPLAARPHVHAGRLKAFGITSADRSPVLPELPTMLEQGVTGYEFPFWNGLFAPADTPQERIDAVYKSVLQALQTPEIRARYAELGLTPVGNSPQAFAQVVKHDVAKFRKLILELGIPRL